MAIKDIFKVNRKTFIDPARWLDTEALKSNTSLLWSSAKAVFFSSPLEANRQETFQQAVERLNLTEDYINDLVNYYLWFATIFVFIGFCLLGLTGYFWLNGMLADGVISFSIAVFMFGQGFIFDFQRFQIKNRKLGCTFEEWRHGKINNGGAKE